MRLPIRAFLTAAVASVTLLGGRADAQTASPQISRRSEPKTAFAVSDFTKLKWLEGSWAGTSPDQRPIYARYRFSSDSTIDITYYGDANFGRESGTGRVYLSVGRVYYTYGPGRWGASRVSDDVIFLVPQVNAQNTFGWKRVSADSWTSTMRSGVSGHDRVIVYQMQRVSPR
ncbi:MAG TPA: hypothetical protein VGM67_08985 [Gemmatimonadaceae bacterium]|jgi:hypothetical protein